MLTQLGEWAKLGFFTRTGFGTYALNTPPGPAPSTTAQTLNYAALRHYVMARAPPLTLIFHGKPRHLSGGRGRWRGL